MNLPAMLLAAASAAAAPNAMVATEKVDATIYSAECTNKDLEGAILEQGKVNRVGDADLNDGKTHAHGCWFAYKGHVVIVTDDGNPVVFDKSDFKAKDDE